MMSFDMDPVLAIGLPLGPLAFLVMALGAPDRPPFGYAVRARPLLAGLAVIATIVLTLAATTPGGHDYGWTEANVSPLGVTPDQVPSLAGSTVVANWVNPPGTGPVIAAQARIGSGDVADPAVAALTALMPTLRAEAWPVTVVAGRMQFGGAPIVVVSAPAEAFTDLPVTLPTPRTPLDYQLFLIGVMRDGTRVVLSDPYEITRTPPWHGTVVGWWLGN
jgi:hypothetical protein